MTILAEPALLANPPVELLIESALKKGEVRLSADGALSVTTGSRTGRSPKDRFIVQDDAVKNHIDWGSVNRPIHPDYFHALWDRAYEYLMEASGYESDLYVGAHPEYAVKVHVMTEMAWHHVYARHMFVRDFDGHSIDDSLMQQWTILNVPGLATDPARDGVNSDGSVMINLTERKVLLAGMPYAGEMKKAMFTVLNYLLPERDVLPMHCAANANEKGEQVALFFGLSGTGKTTLSSDPERFLIGDDEHGWSSKEAFNFEGGCYAKAINLSSDKEPVIMDAIKSGAVMENVVIDEQGKPDYTDDRHTQNTRVAYPLTHVPKRILSSRGETPTAVMFLTCDMFGVLPPLSRLTREQAAYYFLSGYTALVGSTEIGQTSAIKPTFSTCFGAPFFPRPARVYAELLMRRVDEKNTPVYLVNTGWTGGAYGEGGERFAIPDTRSIVRSVIHKTAEFGDVLPGFGLHYARHVPGISDACLDPRQGWESTGAYQDKANQLVALFQENFQRFDVSDAVRDAGPNVLSDD